MLVGSVAGQRYWSSMLNLEATITCGIWTPDDQQVYFGTTAGQIIVMDVHGAMVSQVISKNLFVYMFDSIIKLWIVFRCNSAQKSV